MNYAENKSKYVAKSKHVVEGLDVAILASYYWLNNGALQLSYDLYNLMSDSLNIYIDSNDTFLNKESVDSFKKELEELKREIFTSLEAMQEEDETNAPNIEKRDIVSISNYPIKEPYDYLISTVMHTVLQLFEYGSFEMGFSFLIMLLEIWFGYYIYIIKDIKSLKSADLVKDWFLVYIYFMIDVYGIESIEKRLLDAERKTKGVKNA